MEKLVIHGGKRLEGEMHVHAAKNSLLAILAACVLCPATVILHSVPQIYDVMNMLRILRELGCKTEWQGDTLIIDSSDVNRCEIPGDLTKVIRSSIFLLGPVIGRLKKGTLAHPGGCDIGIRPIDLHIKGLRELGVNISDTGGNIVCDGASLTGGSVHLDCPSVGATENVMMAAVFAEGITTIRNAAREPEIVDLQNFINAMGGNVRGAGEDTITVEGVTSLHGAEYTPIPDRIVAGTYLFAGAITGGELLISNCNPEHISVLIAKLSETTCKIRCFSDKIYIKAPPVLKAVKSVCTSPYPGFPTDMQAQMVALQSVSKGTCIVQENLFETRFKHVGELTKMGADITVRDRVALVRGVPELYGTTVTAYDLRGGASLVLAGLRAQGTTQIRDVYHLDRGYHDIVTQLNGVGAQITRETD